MIEQVGSYSFSLEKAELGDKLMISRGNFHATLEVVSVKKITKSRITTSDDNQWMILSRRRVGATSWERTRLCMYDEKILRESLEEKERLRLIHTLEGQSYKNFKLDQLCKIKSLVDSFKVEP